MLHGGDYVCLNWTVSVEDSVRLFGVLVEDSVRLFGVSVEDSVRLVGVSVEDSVRLVGNDRRTGRLEIFHNGTWGTVCDDGFYTNAARVACFSLGFG